LDISGSFGYVDFKGFTNQNALEYQTPDGKSLSRTIPKMLHYSTAAWFNALWRFRQFNDNVDIISNANYHQVHSRYTGIRTPKNTICWRDLTWYYDTIQGKRVPKSGTGHLGNYSYPGAQKARKGGLVKWRIPKFILEATC